VHYYHTVRDGWAFASVFERVAVGSDAPAPPPGMTPVARGVVTSLESPGIEVLMFATFESGLSMMTTSRVLPSAPNEDLVIRHEMYLVKDMGKVTEEQLCLATSRLIRKCPF